jgi:glutamine synthetase
MREEEPGAYQSHRAQIVSAAFADLEHSHVTIVEYVWIGGSGSDLRSKGFVDVLLSYPLTGLSRVIEGDVKSIDDVGLWNFDGSSTGQAPGHDSEVILK